MLCWVNHNLWFYIGLPVFSLASQPALAEDKAAQMADSDASVSDNQTSGTLSAGEMRAVVTPQSKRASFESENKSRDVQQVADWVVDSGDNLGLPFVIVDKTDAKVFVFYADGRLRGAAPALLGLAKGDYSIPGIGDRKLSAIRPEERTTPAGRFVASRGRNFNGKDVLWVDYANAVSLHRVVTTNPAERRLQRLATPTPLDNRISFGCINVPARFFDDVVTLLLPAQEALFTCCRKRDRKAKSLHVTTMLSRIRGEFRQKASATDVLSRIATNIKTILTQDRNKCIIMPT
jgi:hypothetical protein